MKIRIAFRLVLLLFCLISTVIGVQRDSDAMTKQKYTIAWQSMVGEEFQVFMADLDNPANPAQITKDKNGSQHPSLPKNGNRIYYFHLFTTSWGEGDQLFYMDLPDGKERMVQRNAIHFEDDPCVSRDSSTLAYCSKQTLEGEYGTDNWEIICLKTDFSIASRVTTDIDEEMDPSLSGDGKYVYFTIKMLKDRTGIEKKALKDAAKEKDEEIDEESDDFKYKTLMNIYKNSFDGSNLERVTPRDYNAWHPSVSADEKWMAFASDKDGNEEIYIMDLETYEVTRLTDCAGYDGHPCISSDGQIIVFVSDRDGDKEIFSMDRFGHNLVQLTDNEIEDDSPTIT